MEDQYSQNEILMILPRRTFFKASDLPGNWEVDQDPAGLSVLVDQQPAGYASWKDEDDFGMDRPSILFDIHGCDLHTKLALFEAMISRLAIAYDQMPGKYPLYIRLSEKDLDLIAKASHLGFIPYFGKWANQTEEQSEKSWQIITDHLRNRYPSGLRA
ncbi:hypothetical protein IM774_01045 [Erysipelotrichaceae bacterium RD49]|nr:hypothetical protein [Erysipelotrichaceae bacterium RD49]